MNDSRRMRPRSIVVAAVVLGAASVPALIRSSPAPAPPPAPRGVVASSAPSPGAPGQPAPGLTARDIDQDLLAKLTARGIKPSPVVDDEGFLRRAYLDLVGVIPAAEAVASFRADKAPGRRGRLVEKLLNSRRFAERWAEVFRNVLMGAKGRLDQRYVKLLEQWLADRFVRKVGMDRIVRELVTAEGTPMDDPPVVVLLQYEGSREDMTGHLARALLGVHIQCAQCHDHPFERWKQTDFYGLAAFFARARQVQIPSVAYEKLRLGQIRTAAELADFMPDPGQKEALRKADSPLGRTVQRAIDRLQEAWAAARSDPQAYRGADTLEEAAMQIGMEDQLESMLKNQGRDKIQLPLLVEAPDGEMRMPESDGMTEGGGKKPAPPKVAPRFLGGPTLALSTRDAQRRQVLADWMTAPENPYFARAIVNRVWSVLMGRGLVEPVDNVASPDDATHAALLARIAERFVQTGFNLKALVRMVVYTQAYQRSVRTTPSDAADTAGFSHAMVRPLEPEQIFASILEATGVEHVFAAGGGASFEKMRRDFQNQFVHVFQVDEPGERVTFQGTIQQALFILNGPQFNRPVMAEAGGAIDALRAIPNHDGRVRALVIRCLGRDPTPQELALFQSYVRDKAALPAWAPPAAAKGAAHPPVPGVKPSAVPRGAAPSPAPSSAPAPAGTRSRAQEASAHGHPAAPPFPAGPRAPQHALAAHPPVPHPVPHPAAHPSPHPPTQARLEAMREAYEDVLFALLASTEFMTNH